MSTFLKVMNHLKRSTDTKTRTKFCQEIQEVMRIINAMSDGIGIVVATLNLDNAALQIPKIR